LSPTLHLSDYNCAPLNMMDEKKYDWKEIPTNSGQPSSQTKNIVTKKNINNLSFRIYWQCQLKLVFYVYESLGNFTLYPDTCTFTPYKSSNIPNLPLFTLIFHPHFQHFLDEYEFTPTLYVFLIFFFTI